MLNSTNIKKDFPIFKTHPGLVYLDSAATTLKPQSVIDKLVEYYSQYSANVKRGIYKISERATEEYEKTRALVSNFINASKSEEVIFTRGTTESINLIAYSLGREIIGKGDEIVTTVMEHHSNFVPWQVLAGEIGADFKVIDIDEEGQLKVKNKKLKINLQNVITKRTKIFALTYVSNVLGTINKIKQIVQEAKKINPDVIVVVDAAQAVTHMKLDVRELGCEFVAFSGHKMLGPTGVGILWGKKKLLDQMYPFQYGGEMIEEVHIDKTTFAKTPEKFEAGTPAIAEVIALQESIKYLQRIGMDKIREHERELLDYAMRRLAEEFKNEIVVYGPKNVDDRGGVIAFTLRGVHPHDLASVIDEDDISVRAGHHCTMPLHERLHIPASCRISFSVYNDKTDINPLIHSLKKAYRLFHKK